MCAVGFADFVQHCNSRMIQGGHRTRLAFKARYALLVPGEFRWQHLECNLPFQPGILRQIDHSHTTGAKPGHDAILR